MIDKLRNHFLDQLDQTKGLEDLNRTLQNRCDQLENDLSALRDRYNQGKTDAIQSEINLRSSSGENQSTIRQLKKENHFLKDYVHRLSATVSDYQTANSSKAVEQGTSVSILRFHLIILLHSIFRKNNVENVDCLSKVHHLFGWSVCDNLEHDLHLFFAAQSKIPRTIIRLLR